eukprot:Sspe_Gene.98653::Locus_72047_Transcript_1_1_Confidence_1.000_Length_1776::g.98653::m.98653
MSSPPEEKPPPGTGMEGMAVDLFEPTSPGTLGPISSSAAWASMSRTAAESEKKRGRKKIRPKAVAHKHVQQQSHEDDLSAHEQRDRRAAAAKLVKPKTFRPSHPVGQLGPLGVADVQNLPRRSGLTVTQDVTERTGFDILQLTYDKDTYPTTLPEADRDGEAQPTYNGYMDVSVRAPKPAPKERRYCEIISLQPDDPDSRPQLMFVHKSRPARSDKGVQFPLAQSTVSFLDEDGVVELSYGPMTIHLSSDTLNEAKMWYAELMESIQEGASDEEFEEDLATKFSKGLDFLAEGRRETRRRMKNNKALFPSTTSFDNQIKEDELFLLQLPHILPDLLEPQQEAKPRRSGTPAPAGGAGAATRPRSSSAPPAPSGSQDDPTGGSGTIAHKPGASWSGRALGGDEHKPTLSNFPPGRIGVVRVHKSGRVRMQIGECEFELNSSGEANYAQVLVAVFAQERKYRAEGWGPAGCPVYAEPSPASDIRGHIVDGEVKVVKEDSGKHPDFYQLPDGGWVRRLGDKGRWVPVSEEPRAYELGDVTRKVVVTPSFDSYMEH